MKTLPLPFLGLVLALSATASAQCHATPQETKKVVPWAGNTGEVKWTANQYDCKVDKSEPWVTISVLPPTSASVGLIRYSVDTNLSSASRTANIQVGDSAIELTQNPGPRPGMAFSPARIEIHLSQSEHPPKEIAKTLFVGSDEPLAVSAKLAEPSDWLSVQSSSAAPQRMQTFTVMVKTDQLKPGTNQAKIQLESTGASNIREIVPVIVQIDALPVAAPPVAAK